MALTNAGPATGHLDERAETALPMIGGPEFLRRTVFAAAITGALGAVAVAVRWEPIHGIAFAVGLAWGLANLAALGALLRAMTDPERGSRGRIPLLVAFKFAVYGAGIALLVLNWFPILALVAGFTWLLTVVLLRAVGGLFTASSRSGRGSN